MNYRGEHGRNDRARANGDGHRCRLPAARTEDRGENGEYRDETQRCIGSGVDPELEGDRERDREKRRRLAQRLREKPAHADTSIVIVTCSARFRCRDPPDWERDRALNGCFSFFRTPWPRGSRRWSSSCPSSRATAPLLRWERAVSTPCAAPTRD